jgi:F-type H+-transporting ATPase subunit delta
VRLSAEGGRASEVKAQPRNLARRYARALLDVAAADADRDAPQQLRAELAGFARLLETNGELARALAHPGLRPENRRKVLAAVARKAGASALLVRLLELLAARGRLELLPALHEAYAEQLNEKAGILSALAVSAVPFAGAQEKALGTALAAVAGKTIELETQVDPALLGGVLVQVAGRTYDGTVRAQLAALRRRLAAGS